ncbi:putative leucine-rich repeat protein [Trypanosoma theileri]|uniref:Putative leucine-rich repeat protein n=1 Tax=Trypanosoma theileri TaxID=67003 RepID=A0A1X0P4Q2_9TRYP|nr:putative leucine-rich repeat protein [Trypanosoma theileri]ORC91529.1 putative leucine-rich repeat protein [Trypanosoma theileri]
MRRGSSASGSPVASSSSLVGHRITVGSTVYRSELREDESKAYGGGEEVLVWVQDAQPAGDAWVEITLETGEVAYAQWGNPEETRWQLPDVSLIQFPSKVMEKEFSIKKEWTESQQQVLRIEAVKVLEECIVSKDINNIIGEDEKMIIVNNIANEYMATNSPKEYDESSSNWLHHAALRQLDSLLTLKRASKTTNRAMLQEISTMTLQAKLGIVRNVSRDKKRYNTIDSNTNSIPIALSSQTVQGEENEEELPLPLSPFLPNGRFLQNQYYKNLLYNPSAHRSCIEPQLETTVFTETGLGEIRVLCAVPVQEGFKGPKSRIFAVVRDWTGAFCFFIIRKPLKNEKESSVIAAYPLLGSLEFPQKSHHQVTFRVDGIEFMASFKDREHLGWFHDALKIAMVSMYGDGNDSERVVKMRAYSVEFAAHYSFEKPLNVLEVLNTIYSDTEHTGTMMDDDFARLRISLRTPQVRDKVVQEWIEFTKRFDDKVTDSSFTTLLSNHLRVIEELILSPTPYMNENLPQILQQRLYKMGEQLPDFSANCFRLAVLLDYTDRTMLLWKSRYETVDIPFEPCFKPLVPSQTADFERSLLEERRMRCLTHSHPPGIYLAVVCFHGKNRIFTNVNGNLIAEVIQHEPTQEELEQLRVDCEDYQWLLRLGGANKNWAKEKLQEWDAMYTNRGVNSFKARFIRAAKKLQNANIFPTLGYIFDTPILHKEIGSLFILTICEVDSEVTIPRSAGVWHDIQELEDFIYSQSLLCSETARVAFLPNRYRQCVRYLTAASEYRDSLTQRLTPGFYLGYFLSSVCSDGMLMLVPECNRNLPPLVKVSEESPSLSQWRWLQSLNYRQQTTYSLGLPLPEDLSQPPVEGASFESKISYALATLEAAVGLKIEQFYDLELFALDEEQSIYAFFAVGYYPPPLCCVDGVPEAPKGLVPMTFKLVRVVDDHHLRRYWHHVYNCLADEVDLAYRKLSSTIQPFTSDEAIRLNPTGEVMVYMMDMDKYTFLLSWTRTLALWVETDGQTLVQKYASHHIKMPEVTPVKEEKKKDDDDDDSEKKGIKKQYYQSQKNEKDNCKNSLSIEQIVDIAVSNQAAATDPNLFAMKSLMLQLRSTGKQGWGSILQRIQEIDDTMTEGYTCRLAAPEEVKDSPLTLHSFDDVTEDDMLSVSRPPTVYELPCSLMEFISGEGNVAEAFLFAREIVEEIIDVAVAGGAVAVVGQVMETMVSCVEAAEDIVDGAALENLRAEAEEQAWNERCALLQEWSSIFNARDRPSVLDNEILTDAPEPLFYTGSQYVVETPTDGLRICLARAANDANQLQELLRVANSALHAFELTECVHAYNDALQKHEEVLDELNISTSNNNNNKNSNNDIEEKKTDENFIRNVKSTSTTTTTTPLRHVTLVSREQREVPLYSLSPFRCLTLQGERMRVPLPEFDYAELRVFAEHMNTEEEEVATQLRELNPNPDKLERLLKMTLELQAPLLSLRLISLIYCPYSGRFYDEEANKVRELLSTDSFFFTYGVRDWIHMEELGGSAVTDGFDLLWWLRYLREAGDGSERYSSYCGSWKQMYVETRVRVLLSRGVRQVSEEEVALWLEAIGPCVGFLSFSGETNITDAEVNVLAATCPLLQSLDLAGTAVTDESVRLLCSRCRRLVECSVAGSRVSREALILLNETCRKNAENP